jgi:hypothetical protein
MSLHDFLPEAAAFVYALSSLIIIVSTARWGLALLPGLFLLGSGLTLALELQEYWVVQRSHRRVHSSRLSQPRDIRTG